MQFARWQNPRSFVLLVKLNLINQASLAALKPTQPQSALAEESAFENETAAVSNAPIVNEAKESRFQLVLSSFQEVATFPSATPELTNPSLLDVDASWITAEKPTATAGVGSFEPVQNNDAGSVQSGTGVSQPSTGYSPPSAGISISLSSRAPNEKQTTDANLRHNSQEIVGRVLGQQVVHPKAFASQPLGQWNSADAISVNSPIVSSGLSTGQTFSDKRTQLSSISQVGTGGQNDTSFDFVKRDVASHGGVSQGGVNQGGVKQSGDHVQIGSYRTIPNGGVPNVGGQDVTHLHQRETQPISSLESATRGNDSTLPLQSTQKFAAEIKSKPNVSGPPATFETTVSDRLVSHGAVSKFHEVKPSIAEDSAIENKHNDSPVDSIASTASGKKDSQIPRPLASSANLSRQSLDADHATELAGAKQKDAGPTPSNSRIASAETTTQTYANPQVRENRNASVPVERVTNQSEFVTARRDSAIDGQRDFWPTASLSGEKDVANATAATEKIVRPNNASQAANTIYSRPKLSNRESSSLERKTYSVAGDPAEPFNSQTELKLANSIPVDPSAKAARPEAGNDLELGKPQVAGANAYSNNKTTTSNSSEPIAPGADFATVRNLDQSSTQSIENTYQIDEQIVRVSPSKAPVRHIDGTTGIDQILEPVGLDNANLDSPILGSVPRENVLQPKSIPLDGSSSQFEQSLRDIILQRENAMTNREANPQVTKIQIAINPPELGEIEIRLTRAYEQSRASITVANESALNSLQSNLGNLRATLESFGVQISEVDMFTDQQESERSSAQPDSDRPDQQEQFAQTNNPNEQGLRQDRFDGIAGDLQRVIHKLRMLIFSTRPCESWTLLLKNKQKTGE